IFGYRAGRHLDSARTLMNLHDHVGDEVTSLWKRKRLRASGSPGVLNRDSSRRLLPGIAGSWSQCAPKLAFSLAMNVFVLLTAVEAARLAAASESASPLLRTVNLNRDESEEVNLSDGTKTRVKLLDVEETRDPLRAAVRQVRVKVEVNGQTT